MLCDAATVREGLLHILGGGIMRLNRSSFPAHLAAALALQISLHPTEAGVAHRAEAIIQGEDGSQIAKATAQFQVGGGDLAPGEEYTAPIVIPMMLVEIPAVGGYSMEILIDGEHRTSLPFRAILMPPAAAPPMSPA